MAFRDDEQPITNHRKVKPMFQPVETITKLKSRGKERKRKRAKIAKRVGGAEGYIVEHSKIIIPYREEGPITSLGEP